MSDPIGKHLDSVDAERRDAVVKLVRGAAFVVPVVVSFAVDGRTARAGFGDSSNMTTSGFAADP